MSGAGPVMIDGLEWVPDPARQQCQTMIWKQAPWTEVRNVCGGLACAPGTGCEVISGYSEAEAKKMKNSWLRSDGESLYEHELRHILGDKARGLGPMRHPEWKK